MSTVTVDPDVFRNIVPDEMQDRPQWLLWDDSAEQKKPFGWHDDRGTLDGNASWTDPDDWLAFETALEAAQQIDSVGIGYVFARDNTDYPQGLYGGLDLDGCVNDGSPKEWLPSLDPFFEHGAYMDYSPSGTGIHVPLLGFSPPEWWTNISFDDREHEGVEAYGSKFFTVTADTLRGAGETVAESGGWVEQWLIQAHIAITGEHPTQSDDRDIEHSREDLEDIETTDSNDVIFDAIDQLRPADLQLSSSRTEDENDEWESWDPAYRTSNSGKSLKRSKSNGVFLDFNEAEPSKCTPFGVLDIYAAENGIISRPWDDLDGDDWIEALDRARDDDAPIPEYTGGRGDSTGQSTGVTAENAVGDGGTAAFSDSSLADAILDEPGEWFAVDDKTIHAHAVEDYDADEVADMFRECDLPTEVRADLATGLNGDYGDAVKEWYMTGGDGWSVEQADTGPATSTWGIAQYHYSPDSDAEEDLGRWHSTEIVTDRFTLRTNKESLHIYCYDPDKGIYAADGKQQVRQAVSKGLEYRAKKSRANNIIYEVQNRTFTEVEDFGGPAGYVCVGNGVLDLDTRKRESYSPEHLFLSAVGTNYDDTAECPTWLDFIEDMVKAEDIDKLQEYAGYCLMHWDQPYKKALFLLGPTDSGKSTFLNVITEILGGRENVASETLHSIVDTRWGAAQLFGKFANIYNDLDAQDIDMTGRFKTLTGNDKLVTAERKREQKFQFVPRQKFMFSANQVPSVSDADDAFYNRWIHVSFPHSLPEHEQDPELEGKLLDEAPGILNWMLDGYDRLVEQGEFSGERAIGKKEEFWAAHGDSIARFKHNCLDVTGQPGDMEAVDDVYNAYGNYCDEIGLATETQNTLTRELKKSGEITKKERKINGSRQYGYIGCTFTEIGERASDDDLDGDGDDDERSGAGAFDRFM